MCVIGLQFDPASAIRLRLAANRDEFLNRQTLGAHWWPDSPTLFGGRDEVARGSWMVLTTGGRVVALTNLRNTPPKRSDAPSRGSVVTRLALASGPVESELAQVGEESAELAGFNLLVYDEGSPARRREPQCFVLSNRGPRAGRPERLAPGLHGLGNDPLGTASPRIDQVITAIDSSRGEPLSSARESILAHLRSPAFLRTRLADEPYGTRSSALVQINADGSMSFDEWRWQTDPLHALLANYRSTDLSPVGTPA